MLAGPSGGNYGRYLLHVLAPGDDGFHVVFGANLLVTARNDPAKSGFDYDGVPETLLGRC